MGKLRHRGIKAQILRGIRRLTPIVIKWFAQGYPGIPEQSRELRPALLNPTLNHPASSILLSGLGLQFGPHTCSPWKSTGDLPSTSVEACIPSGRVLHPGKCYFCWWLGSGRFTGQGEWYFTADAIPGVVRKTLKMARVLFIAAHWHLRSSQVYACFRLSTLTPLC